jgi:hypothetical protein
VNEDGDDVLEQGGRRFFPSLNWPPMNWRPPRGAAILLAVGLVIGLGAGYALGYRQVPRHISPTSTASPAPTASLGPPPPAPAQAGMPIVVTLTPAQAGMPIVVTLAPVQGTGTVFSNGPALTQSTGTCSARSGRQLQLGVQVTNESARPIGLGQIRTVLPLGGLKVISEWWAPCGAMGAVQVPASLGPGDSTWFSVTVQVLVACPEPLPVQFTVGYTWAGKAASVNLPGFPDLGQVSYPGCTGS